MIKVDKKIVNLICEGSKSTPRELFDWFWKRMRDKSSDNRFLCLNQERKASTDGYFKGFSMTYQEKSGFIIVVYGPANKELYVWDLWYVIRDGRWTLPDVVSEAKHNKEYRLKLRKVMEKTLKEMQKAKPASKKKTQKKVISKRSK